jgi:hypothetical protein
MMYSSPAYRLDPTGRGIVKLAIFRALRQPCGFHILPGVTIQTFRKLRERIEHAPISGQTHDSTRELHSNVRQTENTGTTGSSACRALQYLLSILAISSDLFQVRAGCGNQVSRWRAFHPRFSSIFRQ